MQQLKIIVKGRVQGVFFRSETREVARHLGLKGYVRNLGNGDVEVIAQGEEKELAELIGFCNKGPAAADVSKVDVKKQELKEKFVEFGIRF